MGGIQAPRVGSFLTFGKELSEETRADKAREALLEAGTRAQSSRVRGPGELLRRVARSLGFYGDGIGFRVVFGQSF